MNQAVQMLIARMQTHPEDFFGPLEPLHTPKTLRMQREPNPKFRYLAVQIERHIVGSKDRDESSADPLWHLTAAERDALRIAYTEARRVRFDAEVIHTLLTEQEAEPDYGPYASALTSNLATSLARTKQAVSETIIGNGFGQAQIKREGGPV
jgi:hypothetical protein